ncbi:protein arginine kinase [Clostridium saccharobutylicum]|uniref:Protein-arginine kinase n=1 Tax=Clostridium saccharobutylicum DSM 13864 TaxID=1345695 RepID=U5ML16_CLOSA|nr:protein arginine kinase [Clostridium saccharobutylicum]AGX41223.1 putative ATP:guanido phosphotransferase [Clostridium saccharobutylicum DSM 13864]AQR88509.1 putative ATP:guanido phosphotransferase [Clostridium saccharobutylicum]AQR98407.1 putative ATP:guanido phosphotransferase [Clostridium saccharobutylicum]AQS08118.1 putative ATP:guanido phosphotransferase [Clostridium saccharobutylicum]AQS12397.1 putative ATP:guanido phosphotransferase [Clostridium saccharobutylicum]
MNNWIHKSNNENDNDIVLSSKIKLSRNFKDLPFPNKLNYIKGRENGKNIYNVLVNELNDEKITLYEMWNSDENINKEYEEKNLISKELFKNADKASFVVNEDETLSIMINEEDHIKLQCITAGLNLEDALKNAIIIDDKIEKNLNYAFDEKLGYLTTKLENLGTGMKASVVIHLPALKMSDEIKNISKHLDQVGINIKGVYSEGTEVYGNIYEIFNKVSLGITEEDITSQLKSMVLNIISEEKKFREILLSKCKYELEDKVYRAYGILKSAVLLEFKETINLLSDVRLGAELSLIDIDKNKLNELLVVTKNLSLQNHLEKSLDAKQIKFERAKLVKEILI